MSTTVELPALGESVTEGTVTRWLVEVGETVEVDQPIVEVSTDKVDTEVPSPVAGVVEKILVEEDEDVEVGAPLIVIGDGSGAGSSDDAPAAEAPKAEEKEEAPAAEEKKEEAPAAAPASSGSASGTEVTLPALGESVTEGTITRWLKEVGEEVAVDEPLVEVSTDKVDTEVPSPVAGTLLEIRIQEDEDAEVGQVLAIIGDASAASAPIEEKKEEAPAVSSTDEAAEAPTVELPTGENGEAYVTPLVRKLAKQEGIDLSTIKGTGVGGRIRKQDVLAAAEAKKGAAPAASAPAAEAPATAAPAKKEAPKAAASSKRGTTEKAPRIRQTVAKRMVESLAVSAQLTTVQEIDLTRLVALRNKAKAGFEAREGTKLTFLPFFTKAVTEALQQFPQFNSSMSDDFKEITYHGSENIGLAVDTPKGLLVPVVKDAGDLNIAGIAKKINDVAKRARDGQVGPEELSGSTFTISSTGQTGGVFFTPIINQPNVAILGIGSTNKRPAVIQDAEGNDVIAIRSLAYFSLTYDHRVVDGADAGRFLAFLKQRLEEAAFEAEVGL
ncbi:2-oxoglutarate dehydrogenase, E2 component, dihydrolipoamide succinyltransferase [Rothia nasimurium]|uniref:Dihydrolipoamide acetyltransferase component of pyruvate dehydrogenase complex n=1 Tax=Rothia nasimurium TaxID=85336 RepID=A0A4Y9F5N8_9MICC|nr:2-oxoglutarate dehydrogenase, E2 component, dihydrolipoamide succinyltransferase [Rothia nasimurium]MBF0807413.1 2-oxoglutarate dehydrogenase, E2 component, dihydrolipoamide succinyltransferase [Rothia nasimurium]TFU23715.1 2-oxoglutarate dehydrogenase, E2 component, dihydrolipoamide succinyltransferase [Rothia nasimurium]